MVDIEIDLKKQSALLKAKRNKLFARFENEPADMLLALEIKTLDDQIAAFVKPIDRKKRQHLGMPNDKQENAR